ncbi:hypothetical protein G9A89_004604 [Geosiphon pyriformis]|nr:hypothetical protein G9A89_004604 [Geosiphon pyriformis]
MQQLNQNIDRPAQTVIVIADSIKKTPVKEIDNFLFTVNKIAISVKVLVMNAPQYQAFDNTPCLTYKDMLSEECNWIDVAIKRGVCDQTCQYALSISEKVRRKTLFVATYNSVFNKLYHYPYNAEIIFNLAMALINKATQKDVCQIKEAKYIE